MKPNYLSDPNANEAADDSIDLLKLCQKLQSDRDKRKRTSPEKYSRDEDAFAERIRFACGNALLQHRLLPVTTILSAIGAGMERRREITLLPGEDYAQKALEYLPEEGDAP
jgi:hypothetical protein